MGKNRKDAGRGALEREEIVACDHKSQSHATYKFRIKRIIEKNLKISNATEDLFDR